MMEGLKVGEYIQVLDREDGMYWEAVIKDIKTPQKLVTVWIPLCKLKMTYHARDIRDRIEERPLQRDTTFKRADLRLLVRKRRVIYLNKGKKVTDEVKVNDPFIASIELKSGKRLPYERVVEIISMSDDEDEEEEENKERNATRRPRRNITNSKLKSDMKYKRERLSYRTRIRNRSLTSSRMKSASLNLVKKAKIFKSEQISRHATDANLKRQNQHVAKPKMVDAVVNTTESETILTSEIVSDTENVTKNASSMTEPSNFVPEIDNLQNDCQDVTVTPPESTMPNYQLPLFNGGVSNEQICSDFSKSNVPMANLDFGTSSISVYNSANTCSLFPSTSFQSLPSKVPRGFTSGLAYLPTLQGSTNISPYASHNSFETPQNNNNLGDVGSNVQFARLTDLVEKAFYEAKEQSVLLRRILEGQEAMISHLATIVQGISQASVEADEPQFQQPKEAAMPNFPSGMNGVYLNGHNEVEMESDNYRIPENECNGMDLSVQKNKT